MPWREEFVGTKALGERGKSASAARWKRQSFLSVTPSSRKCSQSSQNLLTTGSTVTHSREHVALEGSARFQSIKNSAAMSGVSHISCPIPSNCLLLRKLTMPKYLELHNLVRAIIWSLAMPCSKIADAASFLGSCWLQPQNLSDNLISPQRSIIAGQFYFYEQNFHAAS